MRTACQLLTGVLLLSGVLSARPAEASLMLAGSINGSDFCATDNNTACAFGVQLTDTDGDLGQLALDNAPFAGVVVEGSFHQQIIAGGTNILDSGSLAITNTNAFSVNAVVAISATDYVGPSTEFDSSGSGTWLNAEGSNITLTWYNDPANQQGGETATDTPGNLVDAFADLAGAGTDSFSHNGGGPLLVADPGLFSMTLGLNLNLGAGHRLTSRGQNLTKPVVPEPASITLLGLGLAGLAARARRRKA